MTNMTTNPIPTETGKSTLDVLESLQDAINRSGLANIDALTEHVQLLEFVIDHFPGGICVFDKHLNMVLCNEQAKEMLEYPKELFAVGPPTLEQLFRFKAQRGEYGPGDIDQQVMRRMALAKKREPHIYDRERPNGMIVEVRGQPLEGGGFVSTYMDVTEQRMRTHHLETLLDNFPGGISVFDKDLNLVLCNDKLKQMLDYPEELFKNGLPSMEELFRFNAQRGEYGKGNTEQLVAKRLELARKRIPHHYDRERPNGTILEIWGVPLEQGGFITTYFDVTEHRQRMWQIEALIENFPGGISVFDRDLRLVLYNQKLKEMLDYPDSLFEEKHPSLEDIFRFNASRGEYGSGDVESQVADRIELAGRRIAHEYERVRPNGTFLEIRGVPVEGSGFITTYQDVTERRKNQAVIVHMAHHDALTDLPNRVLLRERLDYAITQARRGYKMALHYLDLDKFKPVNDTYGHAVGDQLLKQVSDRLRSLKRDTDTVARLGGDEFVIVQVGIESREGAEILARRVITSLSEPFIIERNKLEIGTSIGIAMAPENGVDADELLKKADKALYECKSSGRGRFTFFE